MHEFWESKFSDLQPSSANVWPDYKLFGITTEINNDLMIYNR